MSHDLVIHLPGLIFRLVLFRMTVMNTLVDHLLPFIPIKTLCLLIQGYISCEWIFGCKQTGTHQFHYIHTTACCKTHWQVYDELFNKSSTNETEFISSLWMKNTCRYCYSRFSGLEYWVVIGYRDGKF